MKKVVVEFNIITEDGEHLPPIVLDGNKWAQEDWEEFSQGEPFHYLDGWNRDTNKMCTFSQAFLTVQDNLTDEEIIKLVKNEQPNN